ncbi:MAG TPA: PQQ-dependent sugar dehydrogenase, partial [Blastococcus sp.]
MPFSARTPVAGTLGMGVVLLLVGACHGPPLNDPPVPAAGPALDVTVVADGLDHPWDVARAPDGTLLLDERSGGFTAVLPDGSVQEVEADFSDLFADG